MQEMTLPPAVTISRDAPRHKYWAILIGVGVNIDRTGQDAKDRSLKGAAEDIIAVNEYLTNSLDVDINIAKLTATKLADGDVSGRAVEASELSPTYNNVIFHLQRVLKSSSPGDCVYVHYSGHGTRRSLDKAVALALFDPGELGTKYLYGSVLRTALRRIVEKGLLVTLVLDCCFSGTVLRDHTQQDAYIRFIEHDGRVDAQSEPGDPFEKTRGPEIQLERLLDPDFYSILCACGPDETAWEIQFPGGIRRGAFSYFLVDSLNALRSAGIQIGLQSLHQHILARFRARCTPQSPMLYGNSGYSFFSSLSARPAVALVSVYRNWKDGRLELNAGQAHGVHEEDEYAVYSFDLPESAGDIASQVSVKMKVGTIACLTSGLTLVDSSQIELIEKGSSWKARLITSFSTQKVRIRLISSLPNREELIERGQGQTFLALITEEHEARTSMFQVTLDPNSAYEIQDAMSNKVPNLPTIQLGMPRADWALIATLGHIAAYKFFEKIENEKPDPVFEGSFSLSCDCTPETDGYFQLDHESFLSFEFKNLDNCPKYLTIFAFTPSWEIRNLAWAAREGDFLTVLPAGRMDDGELKLPLKMFSTQGSLPTEEVLKFFVTSKPTAFPAVILPPIGSDDLRGESDQLKRFLDRLANNLSELRFDDQGNWTTRTFFTRTIPP
jgi:hypothetical protein